MAPSLELVACSRQSHAHRAENILRSEAYRTWLIQGWDQGSAVLAVRPPSKIDKIQLMNAGSQFVEVMASESEDGDDDWTVIMPKSVLRTEKEVLGEKSRDRQRAASLSPASAAKTWHRLRVVCSITPGLVDVKDPKHSFGLANFRIEDSDSKPEPSFVVVASQPASPRSTTSSVSHASPAATTPTAKMTDSTTTPPTKMRRLDAPPPFSHPPTAGHKLSSAVLRQSSADPVLRQSSAHADQHATSRADDGRRKLARDRDAFRASSASSPPAPAKPTPKLARKPDAVPATSILAGVCISISGVENPERAFVRVAAQDLGASYSPGMDGRCTHLLCAISDTPKHRQAVREGKTVVSPDWVAECARQSRRVDEKRFAV